MTNAGDFLGLAKLAAEADHRCDDSNCDRTEHDVAHVVREVPGGENGVDVGRKEAGEGQSDPANRGVEPFVERRPHESGRCDPEGEGGQQFNKREPECIQTVLRQVTVGQGDTKCGVAERGDDPKNGSCPATHSRNRSE